jgi:hypothetical protein
MTVDLKAFKDEAKGDDLPYEVTQYPEKQYEGCCVDIALYTPMSIYERNQLERNLKSMIKYVKPTVRLNGDVINNPMDKTKWEAQSDTLAFKGDSASSRRGLFLYNKGVFVRDYTHSQFGVSGIITSTSKAFDVNMARNDVQQATCELWKQIPALIKPFREKQQRSKSLTDQDRFFIINQILAGEIEYDDFKTKKIFCLASGSYVTFSQLIKHANGIVTMPPCIPSLKGEAIHTRKLATVLSCDYIENIGFQSLERLFDSLSGALQSKFATGRDYRFRDLATDINRIKIKDFDENGQRA